MQNLFGGKKGYNYSRLWHYNRVIDNEICYHASVTSDIYELFDQRYYMHKQVAHFPWNLNVKFNL